ncbi:MAG: SBBP repeat-containing protein [candidate division Zixibacteria bacterium]|nr:SBBP repeat-containing protein [candidate division Zixibacteria bacterium]
MTKSKIPLKAGKLLILVILLLVSIPVFAQVDTAWVRRYNGPGNSGDYARAIAVDGSGNVYVTGGSRGSGTYDADYATIKYYPDGDTAWVRGYNGPGNGDDQAYAIAADGSGNVYVTGHSDGSGTYDDYATIKYYPNGDTAWVRRYNGPGNYYDRAEAIAVDGSGNVYVTGCSNGSGTADDYATIKYYPDGDTAWVRRYNGPGNYYDDDAYAIAVDGSGNVYVTGCSNGSGTAYATATIKYHPNGDTAWVRRYNEPGNGDAGAYAIAVDGSGNVYVTGWSRDSGTYDADYATIKYYPDGDTAWVRRYNGPGNGTDWVRAIAVDGSGNVYVTGISVGSGTYEDYATVKYDSNGNQLWVSRYNGPGNSEDYAGAIAIDVSGNVYVTGYSWESGTDYDYATIKYVQTGPSFDVAVEIKEDKLAMWNAIPTTHWFVLPLSVMNNGLVTLGDLEVTLNIAGNIFTHMIPSLNPGQEKVIRDSVDIPRIWENKNIVGSVTSVEGYPVDIHDSKQVSVYYCTGGDDAHPFTIFRDFYNFQNPDFDWGEFREAFEFLFEFLNFDFIINCLLPELVFLWTGHCVGMSASADAYFLDPSQKPPPFKETREMNLSDEGVFRNIIWYHFSQFTTDQLYESFDGMEANDAEESAKTLIVDNFPPLVYLRNGASSHAVLGYKLLRDNTIGKSILYLYDNEYQDEVLKADFNLNNNTFNYQGWGGIRIFQPIIDPLNGDEWLSGLSDWLKHQIHNLWDAGLARFGLACPVKMLLTDEYGRRVGFVDGISFVNEIPGAEVIFLDGGNGDTLAFYDAPKDLNYTVNYFGDDIGLMNAEVLKPKSEETAITLSYVGVEVSPDMVATLLVDSTEDYNLNIDEDGDGTIDTVINPTVDNLPPTPFDLLSPLDQETVLLYPFGFDWSSSSDLNGDTIFYRVYIDTDSSFSSADSSESVTDISWVCTIPLQDSTTYFWKVKAFDNKGGGTFSEQMWSFFLVLPFISGDANGDGVIDLGDVVYLINYLYRNGTAPDPLPAGDCNCDGIVDLGDVVYLINYLYRGGPPPCR